MIEYFVTYCMYQEQKNDWEKDNICSYANLINERTDKCKDFVWLLRRETPLREINLQIELLGKKKILDVIRIVGMYRLYKEIEMVTYVYYLRYRYYTWKEILSFHLTDL